MNARATTIDEYLSGVSDDKRAALERLRKAIRAAAPRAVECISYQLPAFRLDGKFLVAFGAAANHCAFYPGGIVEAFADELRDYNTSKGTIRFQPERPLPANLTDGPHDERLTPRHISCGEDSGNAGQRQLHPLFQGEVVSDVCDLAFKRIPGARIKHRVKQNWAEDVRQGRFGPPFGNGHQ